MKNILLCFSVAVLTALTSCETNKTDNTTNSADTAVLVNDPANTMNAAPIKDTVIIDTVR